MVYTLHYIYFFLGMSFESGLNILQPRLICCWVTVSIAGCGGGSLWFFSGSTSLDNPIDDGFTSEDIIYLHFLSKVIFSQCGCFCLLFCFFNEQYSQKSGSFPMFRICGLVWFRDGGCMLTALPFLATQAICLDKGLLCPSRVYTILCLVLFSYGESTHFV